MANKHQIFRWDIAELMKMRMLVRLKRIESTDWWFLIMFVSISQVVCRGERVGSIVVYSIQVVNSCYSLTQIINHQVKIQIKMKYFSLLLSIYTNRFLLLICSLLKSEKYYLIIILKYSISAILFCLYHFYVRTLLLSQLSMYIVRHCHDCCEVK